MCIRIARTHRLRLAHAAGSAVALLMLLCVVACGDGDDPSQNALPGEQQPTVQRVLPEGYRKAESPRFRPDGTQLAMLGLPADDATGDATHLLLTELDGSQPRVLVDEGLNYLSTMAWSADGETLYYSGAGGIWRRALSADASPTLVLSAFAVASFDVSPDGSAIAWTVNGSSDLRIAPLDVLPVPGDAQRVLAQGRAPRFGVDGTRLAMVDGEGRHALISLEDERVIALPHETDYLGSAAWIDDGRLLLLSDDEIMLYEIAGERATRQRDGFAALSIDASLSAQRYIYAVNGQPALTLVTLP